jgi:hypothetical protein
MNNQKQVKFTLTTKDLKEHSDRYPLGVINSENHKLMRVNLAGTAGTGISVEFLGGAGSRGATTSIVPIPDTGRWSTDIHIHHINSEFYFRLNLPEGSIGEDGNYLLEEININVEYQFI